MLRAPDGGVRAFLAQLGDRVLRFQPDSTGPGYLDKETKSSWDLEMGICQSGKLEGKKLRQLAVTAAFWFAWITFYPNTDVEN